MHKCSICNIEFGQFFLYQMHQELDHKNRALKSEEKPKLKALTKAEKAVIIKRLETRLGARHFHGIEA